MPGPPVQLGLQAPGPVLARRALLPLPLLVLTGLPLRTPAADTFEFNGKAGLTELEIRAEMYKKLEAAAASGKGIDVERRGQFNEKALFSEDFYFKFGLRPTPEDLKNKPVEELPFAPIQRRYTGYKKYEARIKRGSTLRRRPAHQGAGGRVGGHRAATEGVKGTRTTHRHHAPRTSHTHHAPATTTTHHHHHHAPATTHHAPATTHTHHPPPTPIVTSVPSPHLTLAPTR